MFKLNSIFIQIIKWILKISKEFYLENILNITYSGRLWQPNFHNKYKISTDKNHISLKNDVIES